ncbi:MAG: hypothetical protein AAFQ94_08425 [Bacteroidota bacterium]
MKKILIYVIFLLILFNPAYGQKYKDIFPVLNEKNYQEGEPMLRKFMADSKNDDHPNGNLQMALLLETKAEKLNIISDSTKLIRYCDSINRFYTNAKLYITEKELKKRDEYYEKYYRRDLRTGEFSIKKSDIDGDMEKRMAYYKEVKAGAKYLAYRLPKLEQAMTQSRDLYVELIDDFKQKAGVALSLTKESIAGVTKLGEQNDATKTLISDIQNRVALLPEVGFNSDEEVLDVNDITADGRELKSVYEGEFRLWDYSVFSKEILALYDDKVLPYREALDKENAKFEKMLKSLSQSIIPAESPFVDKGLLATTAELDPENIAISILKFKADLVKYRLVDLDEVEDLTLVYKLQEKYDSLNKIVAAAAEHVKDFATLNTPQERKKYATFLTAKLGRVTLIEQYIEDQQNWVNNRIYFIGQRSEELSEAIRWGTNGADSVAVFTEAEDQLANRITTYMKQDTVNYYVLGGFNVSETPFSAFFTRIDDGMNIMWKYDIETKQEFADSLSNENIVFQVVQGNKDFITTYFTEDQAEFQFFAFDKRSGDVKWKSKVKPEKPIFDVKYNELTKETVIYLDDPETVAEGQDVAYLVIDKFGKVRK